MHFIIHIQVIIQDQGGVIASTGFYLDNDTTTEYFFDDDGSGNLRIYSLSSAGVRTYLNSVLEQ